MHAVEKNQLWFLEMSGLQVGLGTPTAQNSIRSLSPCDLPSPTKISATQKDLSKMSIQNEKGTPVVLRGAPETKKGAPKALVIAGPSGVGKGTLIEVDNIIFL